MQLPEIADEMNHAIDGGSLLQRIPWKRDETFSSVATGYVEYIQQKFTNPIVVFDVYNAGPGTKDTAHLRRTKGLVSPKVNFVGRTKNVCLLRQRKNTFCLTVKTSSGLSTCLVLNCKNMA